MWYPPLDPELLTLPSLDCHSGGVPDLDSPVPVDHWVILGTDEAPADWGAPVEYDPAMRRGLHGHLPDTVIGWHFDGTLPNGDFAISHTDLLSGDLERVTRVRP